MDLFIKKLNISSSQNMNEVVLPCIKIIYWINSEMNDYNKSFALCYKDIETLFKATLYLHDCFRMYDGETLLQAMISEHPWMRPVLEAYYNNYTKDSCMTDLCHFILNKTQNGYAHLAHIAQLMQQYFNDLIPKWRNVIEDILKEAEAEQHLCEVQRQIEPLSDQLRMLHIVQRTFQLPVLQINKAVQRMLIYLPFNVLGQLFLIAPNNELYTRCCIIAEIICKQLTTEQAEENQVEIAHFVQAIYIHTSSTESGLRLLYQCLAESSFVHSLIHYLMQYYDKYIEYLDHERMQLNAVTALLPFANVLYITQVLLSRKSPCRLQFYTMLQDAKYVKTLFELLNRMAFVYM